MEWTIRRAEPRDADPYSKVRLEAMEQAYAHFMPAEFFADMGSQHDARVTEYRVAIADEQRLRARGQASSVDHWVAEVDGRVVAVCTVTAGPREWEVSLGLGDPPVSRQLASLYALPSTHGSGLAQQLLDTAIAPSDAAYLWVMADNPRAIRFYERNRFVAEPGEVAAGESWFHKPMRRMWRSGTG